jgi:hypothetical protein
LEIGIDGGSGFFTTGTCGGNGFLKIGIDG